MAIKRITADEASQPTPGATITRRSVPQSVDTMSVASRERDAAVSRILVLEREVADLKERMRLASSYARDYELANDDDLDVLLDFLDPSKPLPQPKITKPEGME
jgi:hypothetical protein